MKPLKHSKVKNTGILFELLVRQITADTLNDNTSHAVDILKCHFNEGTILHKEIGLYKHLIEEKFKTEANGIRFVEAVISSRKKLCEADLRRAKYNLIKDIQKKLVFENFINARIGNYKLLASIYKLFEFAANDNPADFTRSQNVLLEHVISTPTEKKDSVVISEVQKQDPTVQMLASKIIINRFNEKYENLNTRQKTLLREYVNVVNNSPKLLNVIKEEAPTIKKELKRLKARTASKVIRIKLNEVAHLLDKIDEVKIVQDKHILTMLRYYELVDKLTEATKGAE